MDSVKSMVTGTRNAFGQPMKLPRMPHDELVKRLLSDIRIANAIQITG